MKSLIFSLSIIVLFYTHLFAQSTLHYIDKNATGSNNGTSWQNAWQNFSGINWNSISGGDTLYISGGLIAQYTMRC